MMEVLEELSLFQRVLWRIHFFFGYLAMKHTFDKPFAKDWYARSLATLEKPNKLTEATK